MNHSRSEIIMASQAIFGHKRGRSLAAPGLWEDDAYAGGVRPPRCCLPRTWNRIGVVPDVVLDRLPFSRMCRPRSSSHSSGE